MTPPNWAAIQNADGVDLTLIRAMLRRTPEERVRLAEASASEARYVQQHAKRIIRPRPAPTEH